MRKRRILVFFVSAWMGLLALACKDPYEPPVIQLTHNYLVVEGLINAGTDSTIITLSRTRNLGDTTSFTPELNARVVVESQNGGRHFLMEIGNGKYAIKQLNLTATEMHRLTIETSNGFLYASDYVPAKITPAIDSLSWARDRDVTVFLSTHDPSNNTRYYRWDFNETWEYHAFYDTNLGYNYNTLQVYFRDSTELLWTCWSSANSNSVLVGTSAKLSEDMIDHTPIAMIPESSDKISVRYSIQVRQYALTEEAFEYWQQLKKTSEQLGTLFDPQPAQLIGNISCLNNPEEPVIGFVSISTVQEKRIFIKKTEVPDWGNAGETALCAPKIVSPDSIIYYLSDTSYAPAYYITGGPLAIAKKPCVDCTRKGGTTQKPSFW